MNFHVEFSSFFLLKPCTQTACYQFITTNHRAADDKAAMYGQRFNHWCLAKIVRKASGVVWPAFFTCTPTRSVRLVFYLWKINFLKKVGVATYFIFILKGKKKKKKKNPKYDSIIFGKSMSLKNLSLSSGIRLPIGKVSLKGSTPLSPLKVSTDKVKGSVTINQLIIDT